MPLPRSRAKPLPDTTGLGSCIAATTRATSGVGPTRRLVPAGADDRAILHDYAADAGIGRARIQAALGERERARHEFVIGVGAGHGSLRTWVLRASAMNWIFHVS